MIIKGKMKGKKAWVLVDERTGNSNQARALAQILQLDYQEQFLQYNKLAPFIHWPSWRLLKDNSYQHLKTTKPPSIIISAGRRPSLIALKLQQTYMQIRLVQVLRPSCYWGKFSAIILPYHDREAAKPNIFRIPISISNAPNFTTKDLEKWHLKFNLPAPFIAVLVGGNSKNCKFKSAHIEEFCSQLQKLSKSGYSLLVSTSRRTPLELIQRLKAMLQHVPHHLYLPDQEKENPYYAYLNLAERIIVTGDSISMCSEAIQAKKPVYVYFQDDMISKKHYSFLDYCLRNNLLLKLDNNTQLQLPIKHLSYIEEMVEFICKKISI